MATGWIALASLTFWLTTAPIALGNNLDNTFSINLFKQVYLREEQRNFAISPPVIRATFGLLYQVANRDVSSELQQVMQLPVDRFEAAVQLKASLVELAKTKKNLGSSCTVYRDQNQLSSKFVALFQGYFKPEVEFTSNTSDRNVVIAVAPKLYYMPYYELRLLSRFHLQASWRNAFNSRNNEDGVFNAQNGYWLLSFMKQTAHFGIARLDQLVALELHYSWSTELTMLLVMPSEEGGGTLSELVQKFDLDTYHEIDRSLRQRYMEVKVPRFSLEGNVSLTVPLAKMGVVSVFLQNAFDVYRYRGSSIGVMEQGGTIDVFEGGTGENNGECEYTLSPHCTTQPSMHPCFNSYLTLTAPPFNPHLTLLNCYLTLK